jgi:hypothetical protein
MRIAPSRVCCHADLGSDCGHACPDPCSCCVASPRDRDPWVCPRSWSCPRTKTRSAMSFTANVEREEVLYCSLVASENTWMHPINRTWA